MTRRFPKFRQYPRTFQNYSRVQRSATKTSRDPPRFGRILAGYTFGPGFGPGAGRDSLQRRLFGYPCSSNRTGQLLNTLVRDAEQLSDVPDR